MTVLSVSPDGSLALVPGSPFPEQSGNAPLGMTTNQAGTFLYTGNTVGVGIDTSSVGAFSVAGNGSLAPVPGSPFSISAFLLSVAAYPPKSCASSPRFLSFPLQNRNAFDAKIVSVFDHSSNWQYCADGVVEAYDGETGELEYGTDNHPTDPTCYLTGRPNLTYAFAKNNQTPFNVNGQYVGVNGDGRTKYLQYDGHPGFDFETKDQSKDGEIPVLAAADGTVVCSNVPVPAKCADNTTIDPCIEGPGEIKIKHSNGYFSIYLHLSSSSVTAGEQVSSQQQIGISGDTGVCGNPHLHFEIRRGSSSCANEQTCVCNLKQTENVNNCIPVDPYGWSGDPDKDPYMHWNKKVVNINLWK